MADTDRQVPAPAADWLLDLTAARGPRFVVLRCDENVPRDALAGHLTDISAVSSDEEAAELIAEATSELVGVVW